MVRERLGSPGRIGWPGGYLPLRVLDFLAKRVNVGQN